MSISDRASAAFLSLLFPGFSGMLVWAMLGLIEYLFDVALVAPLQNPEFPQGTQFIHWVLASATGATFVVGYVSRWRPTPYIMVVLFSMLATLCFVETLDFMTNDGRYAAYLTECVAYLIVGTYLLRSTRSASHFSGRVTKPTRVGAPVGTVGT